MDSEFLIVGAGPSGLSCARVLADAGRSVLILEKSRGVGGRCATRRIDGRPVDHGPAFYHGDDAGFLEALEAVDSTALRGWPSRVNGEGRACQPGAFRPGETRVAFAEGMTAFPKSLARDIPLETNTRVGTVRAEDGGIAVTAEDGRRFEAPHLVLALPPPQAVALLANLAGAEARGLRAARYLLGGISYVRCLTVLATYSEASTGPDWHVCYPERSRILQLASHDSAKRTGPPSPVLVLQALPAWSRDHWNDPAAEWTEAMLLEGGERFGAWVAEPERAVSHRWRYARVAGGECLASPLVLPLGEGTSLAVTGEALAPGGGVQAAWLAGRQVARRLLEEDPG
jgi:hypothetical protein